MWCCGWSASLPAGPPPFTFVFPSVKQASPAVLVACCSFPRAACHSPARCWAALPGRESYLHLSCKRDGQQREASSSHSAHTHVAGTLLSGKGAALLLAHDTQTPSARHPNTPRRARGTRHIGTERDWALAMVGMRRSLARCGSGCRMGVRALAGRRTPLWRCWPTLRARPAAIPLYLRVSACQQSHQEVRSRRGLTARDLTSPAGHLQLRPERRAQDGLTAMAPASLWQPHHQDRPAGCHGSGS